MKIIICNTEWASGKRQELLNEIIFGLNPDIVCATEIRENFFQKQGHIIYSESDYGYNTKGRYKVSLWSKNPWEKVKQTLVSAPSGRFISGFTDFNGQSVGIIGVCIPWKSAHVSTGNKNRKIWEDHISYINALESFLNSTNGIYNFICGDMNQRIPRKTQPDTVYDKLINVFSKYNVITSGNLAKLNTQVIDHIALRNFKAKEVYGISRIQNDLELTDHDIVVAEIERDIK
ncbi:MAG: endonuclease/exonuclease/phosphatase family protein [Spirochaetaceae bacterium]|nr:endonuclease/exonuclease/phosphatase family protein [Spirochaetaceae bacterium]